MLTLRECQVIINQHLNDYKLPGLPANLYDPIGYMLNLEGKRIRPSLVLMGCNLFSEDVQCAVFPAMAIEVFHNFTLMHDDIMDKSAVRRNKPTVFKKWNADIAILSGDAMMIKAYELLSNTPGKLLDRILPVFNWTALKVCEGQQMDMDFESIQNVTISEYLQMVEFKTAVLLAASLKIGAIMGGSTESDAEALYEFGRNIGIAFQLQDDLLDVFADTVVFGKITGNDIVSNKKTILMIEALQESRGKQKALLSDWIGRKDFNRDEKVAAVKEIFCSLNIPAHVNERIRLFHQAALESLNGLSVSNERKQELINFSVLLMDRNK